MSQQEIKENIKRLKNTIAANHWNKGYVANLQSRIETYEDMLK